MKQNNLESTKATIARPPIVAILGHVDHGKTTLLDFIRHAHVAAGEAGGITQKIGAYQVEFRGKKLTFIDTPGHAAFAKMRSRGASVADVAVLVVSAADSVQPQTIESIHHLKTAGIPYVVAINKIDLPGANPELVKAALTEHEVFVEGYGGNTPFVLISGKTGEGVDTLLETIQLLAELEELQGDAAGDLAAPIIEAKLDVKRGMLVSAIVKNGTLRVGDMVYAGAASGKVRAILSDAGIQVKELLPGEPGQILGFTTLPAVGEVISDKLVDQQSDSLASRPTDLPIAVPENRLPIILKADTAGSLEAITSSLTGEVYLVHTSTGDVTESDVLLAATTHATVIGFSVKAGNSVIKLAETEGVVVKTYKIIYELLEYLEKKVLKLMAPSINEEELGKAAVIKVFDINGDHIAGCRIESGRLETGDTIHLVRGPVVKEAKIRTIRIGKDEVTKVEAGKECGVFFSPNLDIKEKDYIIPYKKITTDE